MTFPDQCIHVAPAEALGSYIARMRFHQSWYRHHVLGKAPGPNPSAEEKLYGNMLTTKDGALGHNFLSSTAFAHARARFPLSSTTPGAARLYNNMLASQAMCFNLFGPLKDSPRFATALLRKLPNAPQDLTVSSSEQILFEWAPSKATHLRDSTSFDVFIDYERPDGKRGFFGVETKLTEPFSQQRYEYSPKYSCWCDRKGSWWPNVDNSERFPNPLYNQLWRNHLLVFSILNQPDSPYREGHCVVVVPNKNEHTPHAIEEYKKALNNAGLSTLLSWDIETIADAWDSIEGDGIDVQWVDRFRRRYLDLKDSEDSWGKYKLDHAVALKRGGSQARIMSNGKHKR